MTKNEQINTVFVSHRCDAYHKGGLQNPIESLLSQYNLTQCYGCNYQHGNEIGLFDDNVTRAAQLSDCYLAVIQSSWSITQNLNHPTRHGPSYKWIDSKWPPKEYQLWHEHHPHSKKRIGLIVDDARRPIFLNNILPCYNINTSNNPSHPIPLSKGLISYFYADSQTAKFIHNALTLFVEPEKSQ